MPLIYLIRHARPAVTGVLLGSTDVPLAADALAASQLQVNRVFSSPLSRALRTAELMFPRHELTVLPELAERGLGEWEMLPWAALEAGWPALAAPVAVVESIGTYAYGLA